MAQSRMKVVRLSVDPESMIPEDKKHFKESSIQHNEKPLSLDMSMFNSNRIKKYSHNTNVG